MLNITSKYFSFLNNKPPASWVVHLTRTFPICYSCLYYSSMFQQRLTHFGLEVYKHIRKAICVYFDGILQQLIQCWKILEKNLDGILSFTYRSNPPPNLFRSCSKFLKPFILNCVFGKVESNFDSAKIFNKNRFIMSINMWSAFVLFLFLLSG